MTTDNFTPEQIAEDREINGKATTEPLEVYLDTCGVAGCDEHNVRGLAAGNHGMFEHKGDAEFFVNARTRFPLALDEIERLQAEAAAMSESLASLLHWLRGLRPTGAGSPGPLFTAGMGMIAEACEKKADEVGAALSDAVARGKKLLELERRDTPASILRHSGFRSFACKCGGFPEQDSKFCGECGSRLEWV